MGAPKWTEAEDGVLRENWLNNRDAVQKWVHLIPGRTRDGIGKRAEFLKLGNRMDERAWSSEEDDRLRAAWDSPGPLKWKLDQFPGRTWPALCNRGVFLGLRARTKKRVVGMKTAWADDLIVRVLTDSDPLTVKDLVRLTGVSGSHVGRLLNDGHGKKYRIAEWIRTRFTGCGDWWPKWELGTERDAPKPAKQTREERIARKQAKRRMKAAQSNPFLVAAGLIEAPKRGKGVVVAHFSDGHREAA
ncbi:hypothetical protein G3N58_17715 [Paraburkholderia sp. Ac-20342]|uniref:hypothetical protein n=1 Tax=Paraburkholderia sp. Ac-20342 TaxID=2703889 RepID=UPI001980A2FF|nr:hypothetical protein [Paraburkholderia sp. Ac-20342]MBN3848646.1 hypothetical protein [Paraburkholderia sp. Ac-20342]